MKQVFKKISFMFMAVSLATPACLMAQNEKVKEERKEAEQIIITRKGDKNDKIVVEVTGDKVLVNGKEIKDNDGDVSVRRSKIKDVRAFGGDDFTWNEGHEEPFKMIDDNRAMLGVSTDQADNGAEIESITEGSAAEKAGLKDGDIITKIDDKKIDTPDDLTKAIQGHKPGDKVKVTYLRDKKEERVTAELGKWKGGNRAFSFRNDQNFNFDFDHLPGAQAMPRIVTPQGQVWTWSGGGPKLGVSVQDTEDGKGVNVIEVDEDGNAAKAGIREGDIITDVDGKAVNSADEIARLLRESKTKASVKVKLLRKGKIENIEVKMPRKLKTADL